MDSEAIGRRAREHGIDVPDGALDARVLLDVICAPGFSTRDAADRVSGRGVGMSVVRDTIQELGGTLSLDTALGQGTTFRIVLPLTLAITDALIVHVGDRVFAVPQSAVREVAEVDAAAIRVIENNELITHRGGRAAGRAPGAAVFASTSRPRPRLHLIVVGTGSVGRRPSRRPHCGPARDRREDASTIRSIKVTGVSGATELGDGRLVLILEPAALTRKLRGRAAVRAAV